MVESEGARRSSSAVAPYVDFANSGDAIGQVEDLVAMSSPPRKERIEVSGRISVDSSAAAQVETNGKGKATSDETVVQQFPILRSGSYATVGGRPYMEDAHIRIDDLSTHMVSSTTLPSPISLYGVYDGHGGPEAAAYVADNLLRMLVEDPNFPNSQQVDKKFVTEVGNSLSRAYVKADRALADEPAVGSNTGTTALTAFILGRYIVVANAGDCRAVLCRNGKALNMSIDHRPIYPSERNRVLKMGGLITHDGYLEGVLSVSRALGDWDLKLRYTTDATPSPLIPDPDILQLELTDEDEFLVIACDGVWDVLTSQHAVNIVRRSLHKHDSPERGATDLVRHSLNMGALDNLTAVVVCFTAPKEKSPKSPNWSRKLQWSKFGLSSAGFCSFRAP